MRIKSIILPLLCLAAVSCRPQAESARSTIQFVKDILESKGHPYRNILDAGISMNPRGEICLVGESESCNYLAERFETCDSRENVDGSFKSDGLPDFAGETIVRIVDNACSPYRAKIDEGNTSLLRESAVRCVLLALDTLYNVSPYDMEGIGRRNIAKTIILAEPALSVYGKYDIDTLFHATSCVVPVVSPFELMLEGLKPGANIGIVCQDKYIGTSVYQEIASRYAADKGVPAFTCHCFSPVDSSAVLPAFLDEYVASGESLPLDALLIDDCSSSSEGVEETLEAIRDLSKPESMKYGRLVSESFTVVESGETVLKCCFDILRAANAFTHRVSFPRNVAFYTAPSPSKDDGSIVMIPLENVQN